MPEQKSFHSSNDPLISIPSNEDLLSSTHPIIQSSNEGGKIAVDQLDDSLANGERSGRGWTWRVEHMQRAGAAHERKVLHELAFQRHRLGAHARAAGREVFFTNF